MFVCGSIKSLCRPRRQGSVEDPFLALSRRRNTHTRHYHSPGHGQRQQRGEYPRTIPVRDRNQHGTDTDTYRVATSVEPYLVHI